MFQRGGEINEAGLGLLHLRGSEEYIWCYPLGYGLWLEFRREVGGKNNTQVVTKSMEVNELTQKVCKRDVREVRQRKEGEGKGGERKGGEGTGQV